MKNHTKENHEKQIRSPKVWRHRNIFYFPADVLMDVRLAELVEEVDGWISSDTVKAKPLCNIKIV